MLMSTYQQRRRFNVAMTNGACFSEATPCSHARARQHHSVPRFESILECALPGLETPPTAKAQSIMSLSLLAKYYLRPAYQRRRFLQILIFILYFH